MRVFGKVEDDYGGGVSVQGDGNGKEASSSKVDVLERRRRAEYVVFA